MSLTTQLPCWCLLLCLSHYAGAARSVYPDFETQNAREIVRLAKSAEMRNYMLPQVDACQDFYKYACGNWPKVNPAHFSAAKTGLFNMLEKAYDRRVARILRAPNRSSDSHMDRKVKYFFESCMNRAALPLGYREQLLSVLEEFGGMPALKGEQWQADKFDWLEVVALILRKYGKQIIIGVDIFADLTNNEVNRLYLGQLDNLISSRASEYYIGLKVVRQIELQEVLGLSKEVAAKTAADIVDFEQQLAVGTLDPHEGLGMEDKARLRLLDELSETYSPTLNFTRFIELWLGHPYRLPVYEYVESYLRNLRYLIEGTPKDVVANYILWELVDDFHLEPDIPEHKHLEKCVGNTKRFFVKYLDNLVYRQLMLHNRHVVADVHYVWTALKSAFMQILESETSNWMLERTRDKAMEKLSAMSLQINSYEDEDFDKEFDNLVISTDNYFENVVNILELRGRNFRQKLDEPPQLDESQTLSYTPAYAAEYNKVLISVAFLQPRFLWDDVYPVALKFSTVGYIIAHEMAHGFDDIIRKYDAKGNLNNWWDRNSTEAFAARKECLKQQYSEFRYNGHKLPKTNAQDENIADNVGVRIAYTAYENWLLQQLDNTTLLRAESLPHMDYTPRQLFFNGLAQVWCTDVYSLWRHLLTTTDVHAPEEVRVTAMLSNLEAFSTEFMCRAGARMNPRRKCVIY